MIAVHCVMVKEFTEFVRTAGYDYPEDLLKMQQVRPLNPIRWVNQGDAEAYCEWAGMRLPTEQEWNDGIEQMAHSGLWEWVAESGVVRGGSWNNFRDLAACAFRNAAHPASRDGDLGFRCAR